MAELQDKPSMCYIAESSILTILGIIVFLRLWRKKTGVYTRFMDTNFKGFGNTLASDEGKCRVHLRERNFAMKIKRPHVWLLGAVWIALGLLVDGYTPCRAAAQPQTGLSLARVERIGVMPFFKGRHGSDAGETLNCPVCQLYFRSESMSGDADRILTRYVHEALRNRYGEKVIPLTESIEVYERISRDELKDTPRSLARKLGETLEADLMIVGTVWRYRERVGGALGSESPASVAFDIYLIDMDSGKTLWKAKFDETQRPLSENILDAKTFFKRGARWLTADELASYGVKEVLKNFPL